MLIMDVFMMFEVICIFFYEKVILLGYNDF